MVSEMEVFRRGLSLANQIERRLADGATLEVYSRDRQQTKALGLNKLLWPKAGEVMSDEVAPADSDGAQSDDKALTEVTTKAFRIDRETACAIKELAAYSRYEGCSRSDLYRYVARLYKQACTWRHSGSVIVETQSGLAVRELRLPGFEYFLKDLRASDQVRRQFDTAEGRSIVENYIGLGQSHGCLFGEESGKSGLFLAQAILSTWSNDRPDVLAFVNSAVFEEVFTSINYARCTAFTDDEHALLGYRLQNEDLPEYSVDQIECASKALHRYLVERTQEKLSEYELHDAKHYSEAAISLIHGSNRQSASKALKTLFEQEQQELRDFLRLWQYESLDCRAAWWVERLARETYSGPITALVDFAFRLLARIANNIEDRKQAFEVLNAIDLDDKRKGTQGFDDAGDAVGGQSDPDVLAVLDRQLPIRSVSGLKTVVAGLCQDNEFGWQKDSIRPWLIGRDQPVRCALVGEQLRNRLNHGDLRFSYEAYDCHDGIVGRCWLEAETPISEVVRIRNLVDQLVEIREQVSSSERADLSGTGIRLHGPEGQVLVLNTLRRVCSLGVAGKDSRAVNRSMNRMAAFADVKAMALGQQDQASN